jgi:hypothetical protein
MEVIHGPVTVTVADATITVPADTTAVIEEPETNKLKITNSSTNAGAGDITVLIGGSILTASPNGGSVTVEINQPQGVGVEVSEVNKLAAIAVITPWLIPAFILGIGASILVLRRRQVR